MQKLGPGIGGAGSDALAAASLCHEERCGRIPAELLPPAARPTLLRHLRRLLAHFGVDLDQADVASIRAAYGHRGRWRTETAARLRHDVQPLPLRQKQVVEAISREREQAGGEAC